MTHDNHITNGLARQTRSVSASKRAAKAARKKEREEQRRLHRLGGSPLNSEGESTTPPRLRGETPRP